MIKLEVKEVSYEKSSIVLYPEGYKRCFFVDPSTGKYYEPKAGFEIVIEGKLEDCFEEIEPKEYKDMEFLDLRRNDSN